MPIVVEGELPPITAAFPMREDRPSECVPTRLARDYPGALLWAEYADWRKEMGFAPTPEAWRVLVRCTRIVCDAGVEVL